jgi:hypothetical protein
MQQLVADLKADVGDVGGAGLRHPQAEQAHQGAVVRPGGAGRGQQGGELQRCSAVRFCTSLATLGRVTATAGLAAITPPSTVYF